MISLNHWCRGLVLSSLLYLTGCVPGGANNNGMAGSGAAGSANLDPGPMPEPIETFFSQLDTARIADKLEEYEAPFQALPRPDGLEDEVYERCQRFFNDKSPATELFTLSSQETGELKSFRFIDNKYLLTLSDKLKTWRLEDKKLLRTFELPEPAIDHFLVSIDPAHVILASKTKIYKFSLTDGKVVAEVSVPEEILNVDLAYASGDVAVCTGGKRLLFFTSDLQKRVDGPDQKLESTSIAIHPSGKYILFNTDAMSRWTIEPSSVNTFVGQLYYPEASVPSVGKTFDRWISPFSINDFFNGLATRSVFHSPGAPVPMSTMLMSSANCSSPGIGDWCVVLTYDKEIEPKKMSVIDVLPGAQSASVPTRLSDEPISKWCISKNGERIAFLNSTGLHVVRRQAWVCQTGNADVVAIANLLREGHLDQFEKAAEYLRGHKRFPRGLSGEEVYWDILNTAASRWIMLRDNKQQEVLKKIDDWYNQGSVASILASAAMHIELASQARGQGFSSSVPEGNWKTIDTERSLGYAELARLDFSKVQPVGAYNLALDTSSDFVTVTASRDQMLVDLTHNYPWCLNAHMGRAMACLPRWGGGDRQIGAYIHNLAAKYPSTDSERVYASMVAQLRSVADEIDGEHFGFDFTRMTAGLRAMMKDGSLPQVVCESAFYACQRKTHDQQLMKELADYHVQHFNLLTNHVFAAASDTEIYKARNRIYYGRENP